MVIPIHKDRVSKPFRAMPAVLMILTCVFICPAHTAYGYCFQPYPTVRCEFLNSDAVFIGTVLSVRVVPPGARPVPHVPIAFSGIDGWAYELSVQRLFRGPRGKSITVFTTNDDARVMLKKGEKVLLFAFENDDKHLISEFNTRLEIYDCGNSAPASEAGQAIRELQGMTIPKDAEVEGRVSLSGITDTSTHTPRVHVVIHGGGRTFRTSTNRDGLFRLSVPPGSYSAAVRQVSHWNITPFDESFDNPKHFKARKCRCARLQFVATPM